jgi:predicted dehydrogenase
MFDAARKNKVVLLESYPYYFQPQTGAMLALLHGGEIGDVRSVQTCFGFTLLNPAGNIRMSPELGGGALLDAGSYALSLIRLVIDCAPSTVMADATWSESGVDINASATLYYADGRRAQLSCGMDAAYHRRATIVGSAGVIETDYLNHTSAQVGSSPYGYLPSQLRVRRGAAATIPYEEVFCGTGSGFRFAAEAFADVVRARDHAAVGRAERASLDNAATLEAVARSARLGQRVSVDVQ